MEKMTPRGELVLVEVGESAQEERAPQLKQHARGSGVFNTPRWSWTAEHLFMFSKTSLQAALQGHVQQLHEHQLCVHLMMQLESSQLSSRLQICPDTLHEALQRESQRR